MSETDENAIENANSMLEDSYGQADLSYEHLLELAEENSPESEEQLKVLAEKYNITVDDGVVLPDLAMKIFQAAESEEDNETLS